MANPQQNEGNNPQPRRSFLNPRQLIMISIAAVLPAIGMVTIQDIAFVIFSLLYIHFLSKFSFPSLSPSIEPPVFRGNKILGYYVSAAAVIGLFLPILYISEGLFQGDKEDIKAAVPHLFLLASQVLMEGITYSEKFALPVRAFVPIFYNSRRIFSLVDWLRAEFLKGGELDGGSTMRLYVGKGLAIANMALWCFNLFGFLLPVYLPKAFKKYYGYKAKD